jgi:hypothetical protein
LSAARRWSADRAPRWIAIPFVVFSLWSARARADVCQDATAKEGAALRAEHDAPAGSIARRAASRHVRDARDLRLTVCGQAAPSRRSTHPPRGTRARGAAAEHHAAPPAPAAPAAGEATSPDALIEGARDALDDTERLLTEERKGCKGNAACLAKLGGLADERLAEALQYLALVLKWKDDVTEARRLITSGRYASGENVEGAIAELLEQIPDSDRAGEVLRRVARLVRERGGDSEIVARRLMLESEGSAESSRRALADHFARLVAHGVKLPPALRQAVEHAQENPQGLVDAIAKLDDADIRRFYVDLDALGRARAKLFEELDRTRDGLLLLFDGTPGGAPPGCDPTQHFRMALSSLLTAPRPNQPSAKGVRISPAAPGVDLARRVKAAECVCGKELSSSCALPADELAELSKELPPFCDSFLVVRFEDHGPVYRPVGQLRLLMAAAPDSTTEAKTRDLSSAAFRADCEGDGLDAERSAGDFFREVADALASIAERPVLERTVPSGAPNIESPSAWRGLLLSGLPQLSNGTSTDDAAGWWLAGTDLALTAAGASLVGTAIVQRNVYSSSLDEARIDRANLLLGLGVGALGAVACERIVSALFYGKKHGWR